MPVLLYRDVVSCTGFLPCLVLDPRHLAFVRFLGAQWERGRPPTAYCVFWDCVGPRAAPLNVVLDRVLRFLETRVRAEQADKMSCSKGGQAIVPNKTTIFLANKVPQRRRFPSLNHIPYSSQGLVFVLFERTCSRVDKTTFCEFNK